MEKINFYMTTEQVNSESKEIMAGSWGFCAKAMAIFLSLVLVVVGAVVGLSFAVPQWYFITIISIIGAMLIYLLWYGLQVFCYNLASKLSTKFSHLFAGFGKNTFKLIKLMIVKFFVLIFGLCLVVIMGFKFELAYSMTAFVLCENKDKKISTSAIMKQSKRLMNGSKKRLVKLRFSNFGWILLCFTVIGAVWALPYLILKHAVFYNDLKTDF